MCYPPVPLEDKKNSRKDVGNLTKALGEKTVDNFQRLAGNAFLPYILAKANKTKR